MSKLSLYYPTKPYNVTQAFGIYNPAYNQFGFDHHNGIDFAVDADGVVLAMCDGVVTDVNYNSSAGNYVKYKTGLVECEGIECYVEFMYMHASQQLVKVGDKVQAGDEILIAGNTGFSTGPHTHISAYRLDKRGNRLDQGDGLDRCFDFSKYYNGKNSQDIRDGLTSSVKALLSQIINLLTSKLRTKPD